MKENNKKIVGKEANEVIAVGKVLKCNPFQGILPQKSTVNAARKPPPPNWFRCFLW